MTRLRFAVSLVALAAVIVLPAHAALPKLSGTVGPGFDIFLRKDGKPVRMLKPGRYTLALADRSREHNFRLKGPGVNVATSVAGLRPKSVTVTLKQGTYRFLCDPHELAMRGSFRVG